MKTIQTTDMRAATALKAQLTKPGAGSHKGQNGKVLVIGGSKLFHAPLVWAAEIASKIVDMVHVASPAEENNELMRLRLKERFWNGIVVPWTAIDEYIEEDECILIGPGMPREEGKEAEDVSTAHIVNSLLAKYPQKRWVVDGGALQEVEPTRLNGNMIITPHHKEWERLMGRITDKDYRIVNRENVEQDLVEMSQQHENLTILLKGPVDIVVQGAMSVTIEGGNSGMTKGGTGDVLAGLTAALAAKNELWLAAQAASVVNKQAGEVLFGRVGTNFNASDLAAAIPQVLR